MSDPDTKRSLADHAALEATVHDVDHPLSDGTDLDSGKPSATVPAHDLNPAPRSFMRFADVDSHVPRRLLNVFPESALEPERRQRDVPESGPSLSPPAGSRSAPSSSATHALLGTSARVAPFGAEAGPPRSSSGPDEPFRSAAFDRARRELLTAISGRRGVALLTAPAGMGKTTLCRSLSQMFDRESIPSVIAEGPQSPDQLLRTILAAVDAVAAGDSGTTALVGPRASLATLSESLQSVARPHSPIVVFIDDAHDVPEKLLADIPQLLAPGNPAASLVRFVLVGRPVLATRLADAGLRGVNELIVLRTELGGLDRGEIAAYVARRLVLAGGRARIEFNAAAAETLFQRSLGVPRAVDLLCDRAKRRARQEAAPVIDGAMVAAAAAELEAPTGRARTISAPLVTGAFALLVLAGAGGALWVWREAVGRTILRWENIPPPPANPVRTLPPSLAPIPPPT